MPQTISSNKKASMMFCHSADIEINLLLSERSIDIITIPAASYDTNKPDEYGAEENVLDFASSMSQDLNKFYNESVPVLISDEDNSYENPTISGCLQETSTHYSSSITFGVGDTTELSTNNSTVVGDSDSYIFMSSGPQNVIYPTLSRGWEIEFNTIASGSLNASSNALSGNMLDADTWDDFSFSLPEDEVRSKEMISAMHVVTADTSDGSYEDIGSVEMLEGSSGVSSGGGGATGTFISVVTLPGGLTIRTHV